MATPQNSPPKASNMAPDSEAPEVVATSPSSSCGEKATPQRPLGSMSSSTTLDVDAEQGLQQVTTKRDDLEVSLDWDNAPENAYNWPGWRKGIHVLMLSLFALLASIATSIISSARFEIVEKFDVDGTTAILPVSLYVFAMGFGPVLGGPLSETIGRYHVYLWTLIAGSLFTVGAALTNNFGALCFFRFMAGFSWGPVLAVAAGSLSEMFKPAQRGPASALFVLMPFLGPGLGPVFGALAVSRQGYRWTQWILLIFAAVVLLTLAYPQETYGKIIKRKLATKKGITLPPAQSLSEKLRHFAVVALIRPIAMLFTEPIVAFTCLHVACMFGILFSFFAAVPYTFITVYQFNIEECGLVFLAVVIGAVLGFVTLGLTEALIYRKKAALYPLNKTPPEHRLYAAMIGSLGLPAGLFWFAWTANSEYSWAVPAAAMIPFAWGNLCVFVSSIQYIVDTYTEEMVASAVSANSFARYGLAGAFPLFTIQMYEKLGIDWAASLLGFVALTLLPVPWVLFKFGPTIRAKSRYPTNRY